MFPAAISRHDAAGEQAREELTFMVVYGEGVLWSSKTNVYFSLSFSQGRIRITLNNSLASLRS